MNIVPDQLTRILVPVLLTPESFLALPEAVHLARRYKATVTLFHVVNLSINGEQRGVRVSELHESLYIEAEAYLTRLAGNFADTGVAIEVSVADGHPGKEIVKKATDSSADLIVMTVHHHSFPLKWLHRDTAGHLLKYAPCPLWLLCRTKRNGPTPVVVVVPNPSQREEPAVDVYENVRILQDLVRV